MHLTEAVLATEPADSDALQIKLDATRMILEQNGRENFSEVRWLESRISNLEETLGEAAK